MAGPPLCTPRKCQLLWCHPSLGSRNKTFTPTSKAYRQIGIHSGESKTMNQFPNPLAQHESPLRGFPGGLNKSDSTKDCPKETGRFYFPPLSMFPMLENKNVFFSSSTLHWCWPIVVDFRRWGRTLLFIISCLHFTTAFILQGAPRNTESPPCKTNIT